MRETKIRKPVAELPDDLRDIIRREVEAGLADFGSRDFEAAMRAKLRPARQIAPRRVAFLKAAPAVGLALAAATLGAVIFWLAESPPPPVGPGSLSSSLGASPGLSNLREYPLPAAVAEPRRLSPGTGLVGRALFSASAEAAAAAPGPGTGEAMKPVPRTSLEQKMRLLYGDRTIERALEAFGDKFREV